MNFSLDQARLLQTIDASHDLATVDVSDFSVAIQMMGTDLMIQVDVSKAGGFLNFQKSIDGVTWIQPYDISIALDASVAKTSYLKNFTVVPFSFIKPTIEAAGYGVLTKIKVLSPFK